MTEVENVSRALVVPRAALVRDRLVDRLRARWVVPVTVLSAPAGYGKTTLLRQAIAANATRPVGVDLWLRCTPGYTAVSSLGAALCRVVEAPASALGHVAVEEVAARVVEAVWRRAPQEVALLIDDVHEVPPGSEAGRLVELVVASLPSNGHLVLAGRSAPPFPLARLDVEDRVVRIGQDDLAFTPAEEAEFAALRGVPSESVSSCGGWPALAELSARARAELARDYVGEEVLVGFSRGRRRDLALLSHVGWFDEDLIRAVLGRDADVAELLEDLPLVEAGTEGEWLLHALWQSFLAGELTGAEVAEARRRAGLELVRRGEPDAGLPLLIEAEAWGDVAEAVVEALSVARPPVARDVLAGWFARLPAEARAEPSGRLLAAVAAAEDDPVEACRRIEACAAAFRDRGHVFGELTCLVQLGLQAWWSNDPVRLAPVAVRVLEMEAAGYEGAVPFACLGRALLYDMADDSRQMLTELGRIPPGVLSEPWQAIVLWVRSIALLQLGHLAEAEQTAERAIACAGAVLAPLIESTRLQALWFQGRTAEVFEALPLILERMEASGSRHHVALAAAQSSVGHALHGDSERAVKDLDRARAAAVAVADAPLVDTVVAVAETTAAVVSGDEAAAQACLDAYISRHPVGDGIAVAVQRRYLPLFYVLVPETRQLWDRMDLGPAWLIGRDLARAVVAAREGRRLPSPLPSLTDTDLVQAHLPPAWVAELALAAIAEGRQDGWRLLDGTWLATRPAVADIAGRGWPALRTPARAALRRLPAPPPGHLELRLLGPVELRRDGTLVDALDWRRERVRSLLTYLVLHRTVSRTQVADDLWPSMDAERQSRNLRVTLTYLLKVLEPGRSRRAPAFLIRQHGNNIILHPDQWLKVDVWDFDESYQRAADAERRGAPGEYLDEASRALALWRGEPTDALAVSWAVSPFEHCRVRFVATAVRTGELLLARNHIDQARELAERALAADAWAEAGHRLLIATHRAARDEPAARRAIDCYRASIEELDVGPGEAAVIVEQTLENLPRPSQVSDVL